MLRSSFNSEPCVTSPRPTRSTDVAFNSCLTVSNRRRYTFVSLDQWYKVLFLFCLSTGSQLMDEDRKSTSEWFMWLRSGSISGSIKKFAQPSTTVNGNEITQVLVGNTIKLARVCVCVCLVSYVACVLLFNKMSLYSKKITVKYSKRPYSKTFIVAFFFVLAASVMWYKG